MKIGVIGAGTGKPHERTETFFRGAGCNPNENGIINLDNYEDIFALNKAIDIYVSASRAEAFSYGILKAISQNMPVVVSDIEGRVGHGNMTSVYHFGMKMQSVVQLLYRRQL